MNNISKAAPKRPQLPVDIARLNNLLAAMQEVKTNEELSRPLGKAIRLTARLYKETHPSRGHRADRRSRP